MKFPKIITDHVKKEWYKEHGTVGVVVQSDSMFHILLDLTEVSLNPGVNDSYAKDYIAYVFCNYLRNRLTKDFVLSCVWMNQYLDRETLVQMVDSVTARALEVAEWEA